jgi:hypothetical protein
VKTLLKKRNDKGPKIGLRHLWNAQKTLFTFSSACSRSSPVISASLSVANLKRLFRRSIALALKKILAA